MQRPVRFLAISNFGRKIRPRWLSLGVLLSHDNRSSSRALRKREIHGGGGKGYLHEASEEENSY